MDTETAVVEAAAELVQDTEAAVEAAAVNTDVVLEIAQERIDDAQETAQAITDAALSTTLGAHITELRREFDGWRSELELSRATQANLQTEITALSETVAEMKAAMSQPQVVLSSSTPPTSEVLPAPEVTTEATIVPPMLPVVEEGVPAVVESPAKRRRIWT